MELVAYAVAALTVPVSKATAESSVATQLVSTKNRTDRGKNLSFFIFRLRNLALKDFFFIHMFLKHCRFQCLLINFSGIQFSINSTHEIMHLQSVLLHRD